MSELVESIREKYFKTLDRIAASARSVHRDPDSIKLVVVTKTQPLEIVKAAIEAGIRALGENYAEEGVMKIQSIGEQIGVEWHMIGHIQSRKAKLVAEHFDLVHSLDSMKLAERLDGFASEFKRILPVLLEFNVGGEASKSGWDAADESSWASLLPEIANILALPNLNVQGLMTMPPLGEEAESARLYFKKLVRLRDFLARHFQNVDWSDLSMGTSGDFEVAVQEGATLVRVGTAIVGQRQSETEAQ